MTIKPLHPEVKKYLREHQLEKKWRKAKHLFEINRRHPSLHTELLEPKWRGIYSFRLDRTYRVLFFVKHNSAEVFQITKHYRKA